MPKAKWTSQKNGKVPALAKVTLQESPTLLILAATQPEASNFLSSVGGEEPDPTGCVTPPATLKVTVPPTGMVTLGGSHLLAAVPSTSRFLDCALARPPVTSSRDAPITRAMRASSARRCAAPGEPGRRRATANIIGLKELLGVSWRTGGGMAALRWPFWLPNSKSGPQASQQIAPQVHGVFRGQDRHEFSRLTPVE